jgi:SAM-dependent methyltransferase
MWSRGNAIAARPTWSEVNRAAAARVRASLERSDQPGRARRLLLGSNGSSSAGAGHGSEPELRCGGGARALRSCRWLPGVRQEIMSDTYSAVDAAGSVEEALDWQDRIDAWPQIGAYKARSYELVAGAEPLLDVGAGTGVDLRTIAGTMIGIDLSSAMCRRAHDRGGIVAQADAVHLPFGDDTFGAVRADRVLQHLPDPTAAIAEMIRVVRRGGRVVACDPDQESLVISIPGVDPALLTAVKQLRRDRGYRNGTLAARLPSLFVDLGLEDLTIDAFPLVLRDPDDAFGLATWVRYWAHSPRELDLRRGDIAPRFTAEDITTWERGIGLSRTNGGLVYALIYFVVSGRRP